MAFAIEKQAGVTEIRSLSVQDLRWALRQGWADYRSMRGELVLLPLIYVLVGLLAAFMAYNANLFPLLFPVTAGFALVGPVAAAGFYELARRREENLDSGWSHFFDPFRRKSRRPIIGLSTVMLLWFLFWIWSAADIFRESMGHLGPMHPADFAQRLFTTREGLELMLVGNASGAMFAVIALAISAFSFPMVVDKGTDSFSAIATSIRIFLHNPIVVLAWGGIVALILLLACIPLFVGLMAALPVLGYATWHLYTRAIVR